MSDKDIEQEAPAVEEQEVPVEEPTVPDKPKRERSGNSVAWPGPPPVRATTRS